MPEFDTLFGAIQNLARDVGGINDKLDDMIQRIATIEAKQATEAERCPYRELLARAANNINRMNRIEDDIDALTKAIQAVKDQSELSVNGLRLDMVKVGGMLIASGGAGAAITKIIDALF